MKKITKEMFVTKVPYMNQDYFDSLSDNEQDNYLRLYEKYSNLLVQYLIKKYNLKEYDNILLNNKRKIEKVNEENMDLYQYLSSEYLNYIYLRNNIYIERLSNEEINYLSNITNDILNGETEKFINNTYLKVIIESNRENATSMFGPNNLKFIKPSDATVIGLRYDRFNTKDNLTDEKWLEKDSDIEKYLGSYMLFLDHDLRKVEAKTSLIRYNDYCIEKIFKGSNLERK